MKHIIEPIARIRSDYTGKFGIPRQSGLIDNEALIVFEEPYRNPDCFRGIESYSHLWLIWHFSDNAANGWSPTVRPPALGGNERLGVFATRSPYRPNQLGLSSVRLISYYTDPVYGPVLLVSGADLMDRTPIFDIKPYLKYGDCHPDARGELRRKREKLQILWDDEMMALVPEEKRQPLTDCLALDPRPAYHHDPERIYGMCYADYNIRFKADDTTLTILEISPLPD